MSKFGRNQVYSLAQTSAIGEISGTDRKQFVFESYDEHAANSVDRWCKKSCLRGYKYQYCSHQNIFFPVRIFLALINNKNKTINFPIIIYLGKVGLFRQFQFNKII